MTKRKTKTIITLLVLWVLLLLLMNIIAEYSSLGIRLPIGWTDRHYPNRCQELESKNYEGLSYFVEPGFPFRYQRSGDYALDSITLSEYCGDSSLISSNNSAQALNWIFIIVPMMTARALKIRLKKQK